MRDKILRIYPDMDPESPRERDNLGTIFVQGHRQFNETNSQGWQCFETMEYEVQGLEKYADIENKMAGLYDRDEEEYWKIIERLFDDNFIWVPLYFNGEKFYFRDEEESMIFVSKEHLKKEGIEEEHAKEILKGEIETLDQYRTGEVYGFELVKAEDHDEIVDSCWGFYGEDIYTNGITDHIDMNEVKRIEWMTPCSIPGFEVIHSEDLEDKEQEAA